jgi:hypothetical protein
MEIAQKSNSSSYFAYPYHSSERNQRKHKWAATPVLSKRDRFHVN